MIYLDNAATTRPNQNALSRANIYLTEKYFNPSGYYREGFSLKKEIEEARKNILSFVASPREYELIFTSCGTESDNTALFNFGKRGNVVISAGEHAAVYATANELKNRGVEVRIAPLLKTSAVNEEALLSLVDENTSLVSLIHVNNETGAINDVNAIAKKVKEKNPRTIFHTDGVQSFGKIPFKIGKEIDCYSLSAHKIGGLKGVGAFIVKQKLLKKPFIFGGGQEGGLRSGTENVFGIKTLEYAAEEKFAALSEDFARMNDYKKIMIERLNASLFSVISPENSSPYILCVAVKNCRGEILLHMANDDGLVIGTGSACSTNSKKRYSRVILSSGYDEKVADTILRISFSPNNTEEEIIKAIQILNKNAEQLAGKMV